MKNYLRWLESTIIEKQIELGEDSLCVATNDIIDEMYSENIVTTFNSLDHWYNFLDTLRSGRYIHAIKIKISDPVTETRFRHFIHCFMLVQDSQSGVAGAGEASGRFYLCDSWEGVHRFTCREHTLSRRGLLRRLIEPINYMLETGALDGDHLTDFFDDDERLQWRRYREELEKEGMDVADFRIPSYEFARPYRNDILVKTYDISSS